MSHPQLIHYDHAIAAVEEKRSRSLAAYQRKQHTSRRARSRPQPGRLRRATAAALLRLAQRLAGEPIHTSAATPCPATRA